jgi:hypothetical protein
MMEIIGSIKEILKGGNKQNLLMGLIAIETIITFAFVVSCFVVSSTANAGFNAVLTAFLNVAFVGGSYYVLKKSKAPIAVSRELTTCLIVIRFLPLFLV